MNIINGFTGKTTKLKLCLFLYLLPIILIKEVRKPVFYAYSLHPLLIISVFCQWTNYAIDITIKIKTGTILGLNEFSFCEQYNFYTSEYLQNLLTTKLNILCPP